MLFIQVAAGIAVGMVLAVLIVRDMDKGFPKFKKFARAIIFLLLALISILLLLWLIDSAVSAIKTGISIIKDNKQTISKITESVGTAVLFCSAIYLSWERYKFNQNGWAESMLTDLRWIFRTTIKAIKGIPKAILIIVVCLVPIQISGAVLMMVILGMPALFPSISQDLLLLPAMIIGGITLVYGFKYAFKSVDFLAMKLGKNPIFEGQKTT